MQHDANYSAEHYAESKESLVQGITITMIILALIGAFALQSARNVGCRSTEYVYCPADGGAESADAIIH